MLYRLALAFGEPDVDAFAERLTAEQLAGWTEYYSMEPWGDVNRSLARIASRMQVLAGAKPRIDIDSEEVFLLPFGRYRRRTLQEIRNTEGLRNMFPAYAEDFLRHK